MDLELSVPGWAVAEWVVAVVSGAVETRSNGLRVENTITVWTASGGIGGEVVTGSTGA